MTCEKRKELTSEEVFSKFPLEECCDCRYAKYDDGLLSCTKMMEEDKED